MRGGLGSRAGGEPSGSPEVSLQCAILVPTDEKLAGRGGSVGWVAQPGWGWEAGDGPEVVAETQPFVPLTSSPHIRTPGRGGGPALGETTGRTQGPVQAPPGEGGRERACGQSALAQTGPGRSALAPRVFKTSGD